MSATLLDVPSAGTDLVHKHLISDQLWNRLVDRILEDPEFAGIFGDDDEQEQRQWAERIMNEALGFLAACSQPGGVILSPSPLVDIGWHTFILYTKSYTDFCQEIAGRYIHHEPSDVPGEYYGNSVPVTLVFMSANGIAADLDIWASDKGGGKCSSRCRNGGGHDRCRPK